VHPRGNFHQTDFPPLSCSVLRGPALLRPHPSGAPAGLTPAGLHPQEVKPSKNNGSVRPSAFELAQKALEARGMQSHEMTRARLAKPDLLANEVTGGDLIGVLRTPSTARIARGKFGRMCTYLKAIIHVVSHSRPDIFQPPAERRRTTRWAYSRHRDGRVITGLCLLCFVSPYPEILIPASPRYEVEQGPTFGPYIRIVRGEYQVTESALRSHQNRVRSCIYRPPLAFQVVRSQDLLCGWL
jgi:hypothetical protein